MYPELSLKEYHTAQKIEEELHACGHDAHIACLLTAARILSRHTEDFSGTIRFVFQAAEEVGYGGHKAIEEGVTEGVSRCFGIHMGSNIPVGKVVSMKGANNASVDWFRIHVQGVSSHVSTPELGADAVYIASQIIVQLQGLVTRRNNPMENILIGIGTLQAGTSYNVVAQSASMEGTLRTLSAEVRKQVKKQIEEMVTTLAELYGGKATIEWKDYTSVLENEEKSTEEVQTVLKRVLGKEQVLTERKPALSGDDFAEFLLKVPGSYVYVGSGNEKIPETTVAHHNSHFDIDEGALQVGTLAYVLYTLDYLRNETDD